MNALNELSGSLSRMVPPPNTEQLTQFASPFPGNRAAALAPNAHASSTGGSESATYRGCLWDVPYRKPPEREGIAANTLAFTRILWDSGNRQLEADIRKLRAEYVFRNGRAVTRYILSHGAVTTVLFNALPELRRSFGEDVVLSLEAVCDDDESESLYVIAVWRGAAREAESALDDFDEGWLLDQPGQPGLTFTYELV